MLSVQIAQDVQLAMSKDTQSLASLDAIVLIDAINSLKEQIEKTSKHMIKRNQQMINMIQSLDKKLDGISTEVDSLRADVAELQAFATDTAGPALADQLRALADAHNEASKIKNSFINNPNATLFSLRSVKNKEIQGFPTDILGLDRLPLSEISHILTEFGCDLHEPHGNINGMGDKYRKQDPRKILHFHLGLEDRFPAEG